MLSKTSVVLIILMIIFCSSAVDVKTFYCPKSEETYNYHDIYYPECDSEPHKCTLKDSRREFPCTIGNLKQNQPGTCKAAKQMLNESNSEKLSSSKPWTGGEGQDLECYARLFSTELYVLNCTDDAVDLHEVSLSFSFKIPDCDLKTLQKSQSVMVDFNGKNDSMNNFHSDHPTCRTFNYTGATFEERDVRNFLPIHYDCMAIGLRHGYPDTYYFLALTTLPAGHILNYTIVFQEGDFLKYAPAAKQSSYALVKDSKTMTLRLVAAAWLSPQAIHVVFAPLKEAILYQVDVKSSGWSASKNVTTAEAKMENIISGALVVQVIVTAFFNKSCSNGICPSINVTLHREGNIFGGPPPTESPGPSSKVFYICISLFTVIIVPSLVILIWWSRHKAGPKQTIFVIGGKEKTRNITGVLEKYAKLTWVEELHLEELPSTLKDANRILIVLTSSMNETIPNIVLQRIPFCLVNTVKNKTVVVLVGEPPLSEPSEFLAGSSLSPEHLSYLNAIKRFRWPLERKSMENFLKHENQVRNLDEPDSVIFPLTAEPEIEDTAPDSPIPWEDGGSWGGHSFIELPISTEEDKTPGNRPDSQTFVKTPFSMEPMRGSIFPSFLNEGRDGDALGMRSVPFTPALNNGRHSLQLNSNNALLREVQLLLCRLHPIVSEASGAEYSFVEPHTADESHLLGYEQNADYMHYIPARSGNIACDRHDENEWTYYGTNPENSQYLAGLEHGHMLSAVSRQNIPQNQLQHQVHHTSVGSCVRNQGQIDGRLRGSSGQWSQHQQHIRDSSNCNVHISSNQSADSGIVRASGSQQVSVGDLRMPSARESSSERIFQDLYSGSKIQTRSQHCGIYASDSHGAEMNPLHDEQSRKSDQGIPGDVMAQREDNHHSGRQSTEENAGCLQQRRGRRSPEQHSDESMGNLDSGQFSCNSSL